MRVIRDRFNSWPVTGAVLGLAALAALGLAYWASVQDRERYLQSRNFRVLAELASQISNRIDNRARILRDTVGEPSVQTAATSSWQSQALTSMRAAGAEIFTHAAIVSPRSGIPPPTMLELKDSRPAVSRDGTALQISWVRPGGQVALAMRLPFDAALAGTFRPTLNLGAFDTIVLAEPDGQVVFAEGRRAAEMQAMSVSAILPVTAGKDAADLRQFADTISEAPVRIAGVDYRMFAQPCCRGEAVKAGDGPPQRTGFVVVGLTETEAMRVASLAISPVLVLFGVAVVMAALVGWPFLKCALMGAQQRIARRDVIGLGVSSLFGLSLATILLLTMASYARLSAEVAGQLQDLAGEIGRAFEGELRRAANQSKAMIDALRKDPCVGADQVAEARTKHDRDANPCADRTDQWTSSEPPPIVDGYDGYTAFALVEPDGQQRVKAAAVEANRRQVLVFEREYFQRAWTGQGLWPLAACPEGCYLESHWSWISGKPQVVLSRPSGIAALPVATLALPMRSVIDPVLPPGFEFAIVDQTGKVHFHSDSQRNVHENLLLETDRNPRLQSLLMAHSDGGLDTSYWGRPYRAHVTPTVVPGWSIVTLYDKQQSRPLVLEWTAAALSMQAAYTAGWIAAMLLILWRGGSWLWPDPLRRPWYGPIAMVCLAALVLWAIMAARSSSMTTAIAGAVVPIVVWLVAYLLLATRPPGVGEVKAWSETCRDYRLAGALLLIVSAMLPAASFFALSYDRHIEAYIKQRQIELARRVAPELDWNQPCADDGFQAASGSRRVRYDAVFYGSVVKCPTAEQAKEMAAGKNSHAGRANALLPRGIAERLPYFTSASIALRELMQQRAGDHTWASRRSSNGALAVTVEARQPNGLMTVESPFPAFFGIRSLQGDAERVRGTIAALALLIFPPAMALAVVSFLLRRVVLADVVEPAKPNHKVETQVGQHVLLLCDRPVQRAERLADVFVLRLTPVAVAANQGAAWRQARAAAAQAAPIHRIAIPDIDERSTDAGLLRRKLVLIEELVLDTDQTVILLSQHDAAVFADRARTASSSDADAQRWTSLIARLTVVDERAADETAAEPADTTTPGTAPAVATAWLASRWDDLRGWWLDLQRAAVGVHAELGKRWRDLGRPHNWREELIASEGRSHPILGRIHADLRETPAFQDGSLTRDQILEEFEERASPYYQRIWDTCEPDERVVLEHVARHGLASAGSRRVVRRLLARGLLRKDPDLRPMNQSFARFVLEAERRREVAVLERQAEPSLWDRLRIPLAVTAVSALTFLVATQREAFDATLSMAVGVSAAVPTLVKLTTLLTRLGVREPRADA